MSRQEKNRRVEQAAQDRGKLDLRLLTTPAVVAKTGLSRIEIWRRVRQGTFPTPVKIGPRKNGFFEHEVDAWANALPRAGAGVHHG